ncbi:ATP-binding protein [Desulfonatronum sp. SC1]|uniref:ATP-binding protein n=1 Tax=Desulfonatronum sp. SC1 TaxID=2109626 RepID=UPI00130491F6|nr:ATP-binding protein [Desulfonatronum sp. SC1]
MRLELPSNLAEVDQVCHLVQGLLQDKLSTEDHFMILLCLREALTNAVIHGNRSDPEKTVTCTVAIQPELFEIVIQDQGTGFAWQNQKWELPPPTSESGRGLAIMRSYFEEIEFNKSGSQMTLRKRLEPPGAREMLQIHQDGSKIVAKATENMVGSKTDELRMEFTKLVQNDRIDLTIDLSAVDMVDSMGMGLLVATHNSLKARQGSLSLINVKPDIYNVLVVMRLDKHFTIQKTK